jgi:murein lipoprotein
MPIKHSMKIATLAVVAAFSFGCASTSDLQKVSDEAKRAQATANEAKTTSENALDVANQARSLASDSNARSMATEEKLNRMFKRSMYK